MTIDDQIRDEKLWYDINRQASKISTLSSGKIDKYEYLAGEEILLSNQKQIIEQAKFTYSPLGKAFEKHTKEQVKAIKNLYISDKTNELKQIEGTFPQNVLNDLISNKLKEIIEVQNSIELDKINYKNYIFNKVSLSSIFLRDIYPNNLSVENSDDEQNDLFKMFGNLNIGKKSSEKISSLENGKILLKAREDVLNCFKIMSYTMPRETSINEESFINKINN